MSKSQANEHLFYRIKPPAISHINGEHGLCIFNASLVYQIVFNAFYKFFNISSYLCVLPKGKLLLKIVFTTFEYLSVLFNNIITCTKIDDFGLTEMY